MASCDISTAIIALLMLSLCVDMRSEEQDEYGYDQDQKEGDDGPPDDAHNTNVSKENIIKPLVKWKIPGNVELIQDYEFSYHPHVDIQIRDAECYSSFTRSTFTIYLGALDYHNCWLSEVHVKSDEFDYDIYTSTRNYKGSLIGKGNNIMNFVSVDHCFQEGYIDCVPRADVVFIRFESSPADPWAIDQINVDIHFQLGVGPENAYRWHFEHSVLLPCTTWLKDAAMYQIGPRVGLFVKHPYHYMPKVNERIRDWV
ncbi:unnamed protein product [Cylicocyclus nassatus]|uniref:Uncharacterized protein n=1 Tax=Cylicocyclus nassatus TaxID=53992 RepID=A0AA36MEB8_CYLNA|nr:unnamed protein product [Cylicocyclus nassatus]